MQLYAVKTRAIEDVVFALRLPYQSPNGRQPGKQLDPSIITKLFNLPLKKQAFFAATLGSRVSAANRPALWWRRAISYVEGLPDDEHDQTAEAAAAQHGLATPDQYGEIVASLFHSIALDCVMTTNQLQPQPTNPPELSQLCTYQKVLLAQRMASQNYLAYQPSASLRPLIESASNDKPPTNDRDSRSWSDYMQLICA